MNQLHQSYLRHTHGQTHTQTNRFLAFVERLEELQAFKLSVGVSLLSVGVSLHGVLLWV